MKGRIASWSSRGAGIVLMMTLCTASALAQQRPLVTEDPETIGSGNMLIEAGFDVQRSIFYPASGLEGNLLRLPTLGVSFGLSSIAELQVDGGFYNRLNVTARVPATFQSRSSVPKVAQNSPAVANRRSPPTPALPIVVSDSAPNIRRPAMMMAPPMMR